MDDSPDYERNVPCQDRAENHAAADNQSAFPISPAPDSNRGIDEKDKQQHQAHLTKHAPRIRNADRHRDDVATERELAEASNLAVVKIRRKDEIENQDQCPQSADSPRQPSSPGAKIEAHEPDERDNKHPRRHVYPAHEHFVLPHSLGMHHRQLEACDGCCRDSTG